MLNAVIYTDIFLFAPPKQADFLLDFFLCFIGSKFKLLLAAYSFRRVADDDDDGSKKLWPQN